MGNNTSATMSFLTGVPGTWVLYLIPGFALMLLIILTLLRKNAIHLPNRRKHLLVGGLVLILLHFISFTVSLIYQTSGPISFSAFHIIISSTSALKLIWLAWTFLEEQKMPLQTALPWR